MTKILPEIALICLGCLLAVFSISPQHEVPRDVIWICISIVVLTMNVLSRLRANNEGRRLAHPRGNLFAIVGSLVGFMIWTTMLLDDISQKPTAAIHDSCGNHCGSGTRCLDGKCLPN